MNPRLKLRHGGTRPDTPRTNGKAERFIQTMPRKCAYAVPFNSSAQRVVALRGWPGHYNGARGHTAVRTTPLAKLEAAA